MKQAIQHQYDPDWLSKTKEFDEIDTIFLFGGLVAGFFTGGYTGAIVAIGLLVLQHVIRRTPLLVKGINTLERLRSGDDAIDAVFMPILKHSDSLASLAPSAPSEVASAPPPPSRVRPPRPSDRVEIWTRDVERTL